MNDVCLKCKSTKVKKGLKTVCNISCDYCGECKEIEYICKCDKYKKASP